MLNRKRPCPYYYPEDYNYNYYEQYHNLPTPELPKLPDRKEKYTCREPLPAIPRRQHDSKFGLGIDRYGNEIPGPLVGEFQDTLLEMNEELAFLKRHPEVTARIPHAARILEREAFKLDHSIDPEWLEIDINKPIYFSRKIIIPTNRYPSFNFIGKIIGSRGSTLHNLGKTYKCHVNVLGECSSRDREKELILLHSGDPRYHHYGLPLHLHFSTIARPHVAYMRLAGFINAVHKLMMPSHDVHVAGITDSSIWYETDAPYVYYPCVFDEADDDVKDAEIRDFIRHTRRPRKSSF